MKFSYKIISGLNRSVTAAAALFFISCTTTTVNINQPSSAPASQERETPQERLASGDSYFAASGARDDSSGKEPASEQQPQENSGNAESKKREADIITNTIHLPASREDISRPPAQIRNEITAAEPEKPGEIEEQIRPENESAPDTRKEMALGVGLHVPAVQNGEFDEVGTASWYGRDFNGRPTANGETFNSRKLTAAHKTMPLGSVVLVKNLENGKEVMVRVNDRGPFVGRRILDVSEYASEVLGFKEKGLTSVGVKVIKKGKSEEVGEGTTASYYKKSDETFDTAFAAKREGSSREKNVTEAQADVVSEGALRGYSVQVGAFGSLENAVGMKKILKEFGEDVNILKRNDQYVVRVGDYSSRYKAEKIKYKLVSEGYTGFIHEPPSAYSQY